MPNDISEDERRLRKLAALTQKQWEESHPATRDELKAAREAVRQQWEFEQEIKERTRQALEAAQQGVTESQLRAEAERIKQEEEKKRKDQSHGHGHGY